MKTSPLKYVLAGVAIVGVGLVALKIKDAYFDDVTMRQVPVAGAPCRDSRLVTPILIQAEHGNGTSKIQYAGGRAVEMTLPTGETHELRVKIGACRFNGGAIDCDTPRWLGGEQILTVDTRDPRAEVVLGFPGEHACT